MFYKILSSIVQMRALTIAIFPILPNFGGVRGSQLKVVYTVVLYVFCFVRLFVYSRFLQRRCQFVINL